VQLLWMKYVSGMTIVKDAAIKSPTAYILATARTIAVPPTIGN
jgi:hypothetical protein